MEIKGQGGTVGQVYGNMLLNGIAPIREAIRTQQTSTTASSTSETPPANIANK